MIHIIRGIRVLIEFPFELSKQNAKEMFKSWNFSDSAQLAKVFRRLTLHTPSQVHKKRTYTKKKIDITGKDASINIALEAVII